MKKSDKLKRFEKQPDYLKKYSEGYENPQSYSVLMEGKKFAIIRFDGGSYWSGMMGNRYCPPFYTLVNKKEVLKIGSWGAKTHQMHEGRLNKKDKEHLQRILDYYENTNSKNSRR